MRGEIRVLFLLKGEKLLLGTFWLDKKFFCNRLTYDLLCCVRYHPIHNFIIIFSMPTNTITEKLLELSLPPQQHSRYCCAASFVFQQDKVRVKHFYVCFLLWFFILYNIYFYLLLLYAVCAVCFCFVFWKWRLMEDFVLLWNHVYINYQTKHKTPTYAFMTVNNIIFDIKYWNHLFKFSLK